MRRTKAECKKMSKIVSLSILSLICAVNIVACGTETENDTDEHEVSIENEVKEDANIPDKEVVTEEVVDNASAEIEPTQLMLRPSQPDLQLT